MECSEKDKGRVHTRGSVDGGNGAVKEGSPACLTVNCVNAISNRSIGTH